MSLTIEFPLPFPIGQYPKDLGVVRGRIEAIKRLSVHGHQVVEFIYGLCTEVDPNPKHPNLFIHVGGKIGVEFSNNHSGSWCRGLAQCPPPLVRDGLEKKFLGVVKPLLLNERPIFRDEAEPLGRTLIDKFDMVVTVCGLFAGPNSLGGHLLSLARHWAYMVRMRW